MGLHVPMRFWIILLLLLILKITLGRFLSLKWPNRSRESPLHSAHMALVGAVALDGYKIESYPWNYEPIVSSSQYQTLEYEHLPGFTRSLSGRNYALVTPESHVFARNPLW